MLVYTIAVDAMGGDHAPDITVHGSVKALRAFSDIRILLIGQAERIKPLLTDTEDVASRLEVVDAREVIENTESPVLGIRRKKDASLVRALDFVKTGQADALVSAGSTGAVMAGGMFMIGRAKGVDRPALVTLLPTVGKHPVLLVDTGANVDCQPEWLVQFAKMGDIYMRQAMGIPKPRVALLNIGEESEKGNQLTKQAYELLKQQPGLNFIGNLEARGVPMGETEIIVADGFSGNILLKTMEGMTKAIFTIIKKEFKSSKMSKLGALLSHGTFKRIKKNLDADEVGGTPLLGVKGTVIKAHGSSNERAFFSAIRQAHRMLEGNVAGLIQEEINQ